MINAKAHAKKFQWASTAPNGAMLEPVLCEYSISYPSIKGFLHLAKTRDIVSTQPQILSNDLNRF